MTDEPPLFSWRASTGRRAYAISGLLLFGLKFNIDRWVSSGLFDRPWSVWSYFDVPGVHLIQAMQGEDVAYCLTMLALALPFVWMGLLLTVRRLREAGLPLGLAALFFAPVLNLFFFAFLSFAPPRVPDDAWWDPDIPERSFLDRLLPRSRGGSAAAAVALVAPFAVVACWLAVTVFESYGWSVFVGLPFVIGMVAALLYGYREHRSMGASTGVAMLAVLLVGVLLMVVAVEGVVCLVMAVPLALPLAALGGAVGYWAQRFDGRTAQALAFSALVVLPLLFGTEQAAAPAPPLIAVTTHLDIQAPPEAVWPHLIAFPALPPPEDWVLTTGIAYPVGARIEGEGVGAVRYCEFTTGAFVEPITVWDEPRHLAFDVAAQPQPMQEWTFFKDLHPAHLDGFFLSERGEFRLEAQPDGRTRLTGTTWYRHRVWPNRYWQVFGDEILHRIHRRVLRHVQRLAEAEA